MSASFAVPMMILMVVGYAAWFLIGYWTGRKAEVRRQRGTMHPDSPIGKFTKGVNDLQRALGKTLIGPPQSRRSSGEEE